MSERRRDVPGTIYLIHFSEPYRHARHYLGWTERAVEDRVREHYDGQGSRLLQVLHDAGIGWSLVLTLPGTRAGERRIKRAKATPRLCPVCTGARVEEAVERLARLARGRST